MFKKWLQNTVKRVLFLFFLISLIFLVMILLQTILLATYQVLSCEFMHDFMKIEYLFEIYMYHFGGDFFKKAQKFQVL